MEDEGVSFCFKKSLVSWGGPVNHGMWRDWGSLKLTTMKREHAFVFKEVAHSCASSENKLCDIFDDLGFVLWRECCEPFG